MFEEIRLIIIMIWFFFLFFSTSCRVIQTDLASYYISISLVIVNLSFCTFLRSNVLNEREFLHLRFLINKVIEYLLIFFSDSFIYLLCRIDLRGLSSRLFYTCLHLRLCSKQGPTRDP